MEDNLNFSENKRHPQFFRKKERQPKLNMYSKQSDQNEEISLKSTSISDSIQWRLQLFSVCATTKFVTDDLCYFII